METAERTTSQPLDLWNVPKWIPRSRSTSLGENFKTTVSISTFDCSAIMIKLIWHLARRVLYFGEFNIESLSTSLMKLYFFLYCISIEFVFFNALNFIYQLSDATSLQNHLVFLLAVLSFNTLISFIAGSIKMVIETLRFLYLHETIWIFILFK